MAWCALIRPVDPGTWSQGDATANSKRIAETFREAATIADEHGERLAAEGEICWGGMHSWRRMVQLLEMVDRPKTVGFQADMAHTLLVSVGLQRARGSHPAREFRLERYGRGSRTA